MIFNMKFFQLNRYLKKTDIFSEFWNTFFSYDVFFLYEKRPQNKFSRNCSVMEKFVHFIFQIVDHMKKVVDEVNETLEVLLFVLFLANNYFLYSHFSKYIWIFLDSKHNSQNFTSSFQMGQRKIVGTLLFWPTWYSIFRGQSSFTLWKSKKQKRSPNLTRRSIGSNNFVG